MALRVLYGYDPTVVPDTVISASYHVYDVCPAAGFQSVISAVQIYPIANGDVKASFYRCIDGAPNELLWADDTGLTVTSGSLQSITTSLWIPVSATDIIAVSGNGSVNGVIARKSGTISGYNRYYKSSTYSSYTAPIPPLSGYTGPSANQPMNITLWGYSIPTITSVNGSNFYGIGSTDITIAGTGFGTTGASVIVGDKDTLEESSVQDQRPVTAQSDTSITFDSVLGTIPVGPAYLYVLTDDGLCNDEGFQVIRLGDATMKNIQIINRAVNEHEARAMFARAITK